jgi:SAM-dependent methyltransferase
VRDLEANPIERTGHVYHPVPFPEFSHLTCSADREGVEAKLRLVRAVRARRRLLGLPCDTILDIGANGGYFTFSLAADGARLTAYESDPRYAAIGATLARLREPSVDWHDEPFADASIGTGHWDVALLLSAFQWISAGNEKLDEALAMLRHLSESVSCLIFELGVNSGASAITVRKLNHVAAVYDLVRAGTTYPHVRLAAATRLWPGRMPWHGLRFVFVCSHDDPTFPEPFYAPLKHINI